MSAATIATGKAKRKDFALFYKVPGGTPIYEIIGKGIEDLSIKDGAKVDTKTDILGDTDAILSSHQKTTDLSPIYVVGGTKFSEFLDDLEENEKILDDTIATYLVVRLYKSTTVDTKTVYSAYEQQAVTEVTSIGGDITGVNVPCTLHWKGTRTYGTFDPTTKTFTPAA